MTSMLKQRWNRLMGSRPAATVEHEVKAEQTAPAEDAAAEEHVGGVADGEETPPS